MTNPFPTELQLDALREVANVGAGHAARALSQLTGGQRIGMDIPRAIEVGSAELAQMLGGAAAPVVAVTVDMTGALTGQVLLVWPESDARELSGWLLQHAGGTNQRTGEDRSALVEAANIIASACLGAVGQLAGFKLIPSVPQLSSGLAGAVAAGALGVGPGGPGPGEKGWVLEVRLSSPSLSGQLLLIPDPASMRSLLTKLGM